MNIKLVTRLIWVIALVLILTISVVQTAWASGVRQAVDSFAGLLTWMAAGGSVVAVSWLLEPMEWFQALKSQHRKLIQYGASAALGILALLATTYLPEFVEAAEPYFKVLLATFGLVFLNQLAHANNPNRKE